MKASATFPEVLGQVVIRHRKSRNLTQGKVAKQMGLPQSSLSRLERGGAMFTVPQLRRAAATLGIQVSHLFREAETAAASLSKKGVTVLEEDPPANERSRWTRVAAKEIEQVVTVSAASTADYSEWTTKPKEKETQKVYLGQPR